MIKFGSTVKMHYAISNLDGVKFESTFDKEPITFTVGKGVLPQKLEVLGTHQKEIIVFAILRQAIGLQNSPSSQILIGLSLFL